MLGMDWEKESISKLHRVKDLEEDRTDMFRMDRNERTIPFDESFINQIRSKLNSDVLTNYPDESPLYKKLSGYLGVDEEYIFMHTGSDLVIKAVFETFIEKNDRILLHLPSYAMYSVYANMFEADVDTLNYGQNLVLDTDEYCAKIKSVCPQMVVMENPNGFIGNSYSHSQLEKIIKTAKEVGSLTVVDEAYIDFVDSSVIDLIDIYSNLIIVRTMSKAWGIAGLRLGYAISNKDIISCLRKVRPMHEFTGFTSLVAETLLEHREVCDDYLKETEVAREFFISELKEMGIPVAESRANFVAAKLGEKIDLDKFREDALHNGYLLRRPFRESFLENWVRIGILKKDDMIPFVELIRKHIGE